MTARMHTTDRSASTGWGTPAEQDILVHIPGALEADAAPVRRAVGEADRGRSYFLRLPGFGAAFGFAARVGLEDRAAAFR